MSKQRVRVTISDSKLIPTIGKGPINRPISITIAQYEMLKRFGFNVSTYSEQISKIEKVSGELTVEETTETPVGETVVEEVVETVTPEVVESEEVTESVEETVEEEVTESVEETVEEEVTESVEETVEEEVTESVEEGDVSYTEEDLKDANKKELKEVLDGRGVEYKYSATLPELKELVLSSNPA
jgi:hypothetical protein